MRRFLLLILFLICLPNVVFAGASQAGKYELEIVKTPRGYVLRGLFLSPQTGWKREELSQPLEVERVLELKTALMAPPVREISLEALSVDQDWLDKNATSSLKEHRRSHPHFQVGKAQEKLYISAFRDWTLMKKVVDKYYRSNWTDDYPSVRLVFDDGEERIELVSTAQHSFMLPWQVTKGGKTTSTFNPEISRALSRLLPKSLPLRDRNRISGTALRAALTDQLLYEIRSEWDKRGADAQFSDQLAPIEVKYRIRESVVRSISSIDVNDYGWDAVLTRDDLPLNLHIGLHLSIEDDKIQGVKRFLGDIESYIGQVLSVPWLNKYLREQKGAKIELRFVGDRSLSSKAVDTLGDDIRQSKTPGLIKTLTPVLKDSAFIELTEPSGRLSRWLILPDKRALLWHYDGLEMHGDQLLQYSVLDFPGKHCYGFECALTFLSPKGEIEN